MSHYLIRTIYLDTARDVTNPLEIPVQANTLAFYVSSGIMSGIQIALENPGNDWFAIEEFGNPFVYPAGLTNIYLAWTAQAGQYLRLFIGQGTNLEQIHKIGVVQSVQDWHHQHIEPTTLEVTVTSSVSVAQDIGVVPTGERWKIKIIDIAQGTGDRVFRVFRLYDPSNGAYIRLPRFQDIAGVTLYNTHELVEIWAKEEWRIQCYWSPSEGTTDGTWVVRMLYYPERA